VSLGSRVSILIDRSALIGYIYNRLVTWSISVPKKKQEPPRGPMIHIRLDEITHRKLKVWVATEGTTIQQLVATLIQREIERPNKSAALKVE
jgi:hypothetical protein